MCGGDGVVPVGWVFVGECHWCPSFAQVPDQVAGEHADQYVGFDAVFESVVDGPQVEVVGFDDAEVAFDVGEVFVVGDDVGGLEGVGRDAGADHVEAVEAGFGWTGRDGAGIGPAEIMPL